jgi:hypothetical protein
LTIVPEQNSVRVDSGALFLNQSNDVAIKQHFAYANTATKLSCKLIILGKTIEHREACLGCANKASLILVKGN